MTALVIVGGFLGAGKTTLILRAADVLRARGQRVAVILNDQDHGLVDTRFAESRALEAREVAGGCFCCRFADLLEAAGSLAAFKPDVIFSEPVGSCIDLVATILEPLKTQHADQFKLAPFSVLVDPDLAARVEAGQADEDVAYLYRQQLAEADLICTTKADLFGEAPAFAFPVDFRLSAKTGEGVEAWLDEVLDGNRVVGARPLDVDYRRYAAAETALGWLNYHADAELRQPLSPAMLAGPLLDDLDASLTEVGVVIAHLKVFDRTSCAYVKASVCANGAEPEPDGDLLAPAELHHELVINLRAVADPEDLRTIVEASIARIDGKLKIKHAGSFRPGEPKPRTQLVQLAQRPK